MKLLSVVIPAYNEEQYIGSTIEQIKKAVLSNELRPGSALPSIRQLANDLELNHNTVAKAYRVALNAPKGLTYLSIDTGLQEAKLEEEVSLPDISAPRYQPSPPIAATQESIEQAADMLTEAALPLVIGGRVGMKAEITPPLVELVELTGAAYQEGKGTPAGVVIRAAG